MTPKLYTFKNLIGSDFPIDNEKSVKIEEIIIPRIQRDYAQGRIGTAVTKIRTRFLDALYEAIKTQKLMEHYIGWYEIMKPTERR